MRFNTADINKLIDRELVIECFEVELVQRTDDNPVVLKGPGSISVLHDGGLRLKLYDSKKFSNSPGMFCLGLGGQGIVPKTDYYSFTASDAHGNTWVYPDVYIYDGLTTTPFGSLVEVDIPSMQSVKSRAHAQEGMFAEIVVLGVFRLPFNTFEDQPDKSSSLVALELTIQGVDIKIIQKALHLYIELFSETSIIDQVFVKKFSESLGIAIGRNVEPAFYRVYSGGQIISYVSGRKEVPRSPILTPFVEVFPYKTEQLRLFLQCYLSNYCDEHNHLVGYWKRLNAVSSLITDVAALVLTVNIEGMIKNYFSSGRTPSVEILGQIKTSMEFVSRADLPDYTKSRMQSGLGYMAKLSVSNILKALVDEGSIGLDEFKSWSALRNSVAHADNLSDDRAAIERFIYHIGNCTSLFYRLIGLSVGYDVRTVVVSEPEEPDFDGERETVEV